MTDKRKNKPDYTKFMKKPAPLEPLTHPVPETDPPVSEPAKEEEIPTAEILLTSSEAPPNADPTDLTFFETISEEKTPFPWEEPEYAPPTLPHSEPDPEPSYVEEEPYYDAPQVARQPEIPPEPRPMSYEDLGILEKQFYAFQPPPVPALIAPILLALLFLAF